jgi:hypothetical protein
VEFRPDTRAGTEGQQPHAFSAEAEGQDEQPTASVFAALWIAHHGPAAIIDLGFFARWGEDDGTGLGCPGSAQLVNESPNTLIAALETVVGYQVLPDGSGVATTTKT